METFILYSSMLSLSQPESVIAYCFSCLVPVQSRENKRERKSRWNPNFKSFINYNKDFCLIPKHTELVFIYIS